jgi:predicted ATPase
MLRKPSISKNREGRESIGKPPSPVNKIEIQDPMGIKAKRTKLMAERLKTLTVKNYRCLADLSLDLGPVNIFFGPNGSGKSTILDTIWFFRDCAVRGVELASSVRSHGIGILWDGAGDNQPAEISLRTDWVEYSLKFGFSSGRVEPFAGERLTLVRENETLIHRPIGSDHAEIFDTQKKMSVRRKLHRPEKLSLEGYLSIALTEEKTQPFERLLDSVRFFHSRLFFLYPLKAVGSDVGFETRLCERGENLWSVLRNLHDRRSSDDRFDTIMGYMAESFPSFEGLRLEQTGPATVYAHFREKGRHKEIYASGVSDGYLQMLLLLTALFSESPDRPAVILLDEPEVSLHPWPLAVLAKAVNDTAEHWQKQVLIATHSPVLLSQFGVENILSTELVEGRTRVKRLSEMEEIQDLLEQYAAGSLYMAEVVGGQRAVVAQTTED